jgi:hypothetical protein
MPTSRFKKVRQNPCDSLREVVYVDVLSIVRDKMSRWIEPASIPHGSSGSKISACTAEPVPPSKGLDRSVLAFMHHLNLHP